MLLIMTVMVFQKQLVKSWKAIQLTLVSITFLVFIMTELTTAKVVHSLKLQRHTTLVL